MAQNEPKAGPLLAQFWSDLGIKYQHAYGDDVGLVKAVKTWLSYLSPGTTVLECGCGTGVPIARTIADGGLKYHGIDVASGMVEVCRKQVPEGTYEVVSMLDYVPKIEYDGIVASLSHFELTPKEHAKMARNWFQWTKPGGHLLISTVVFEDDLSGHTSFDPEMECAPGVETVFMGNKIIITEFTKEGWKRLLGGAGFEIVHTETDMFVPKAEAAPDEPRYYIIAKKPVNV
ncbi:MAG: hypothetical protein Q9202_003411 [Teloschistes flavicans]